jgi:hypothetical protein
MIGSHQHPTSVLKPLLMVLGVRLSLLGCDEENTAPIAKAGPGQTVAVGATVSLDGSGSSDAEGAPLTCAWLCTALPTGRTTTLATPTTMPPSCVAALPGTYGIALMVRDGEEDRALVTVTIVTQ